MSIGPKDAFWVWNPGVSKYHLHIVLTYPELMLAVQKVVVVIVNITTVRPNISFDSTTVLGPLDHERILHPSYVWFQKAHFKSVEELKDETMSVIPDLGSPFSIPVEPIKQEVFDQIIDGIQDSDFTPEDVRNYCFDRHPGDGTVVRRS